jgi:hypothetical protein
VACWQADGLSQYVSRWPIALRRAQANGESASPNPARLLFTSSISELPDRVRLITVGVLRSFVQPWPRLTGQPFNTVQFNWQMTGFIEQIMKAVSLDGTTRCERL